MDKALEKDVHKFAADTILQEGIDFIVEVEKQNWLHRVGILPKEKKYIIKPLVAGTLIRISKIMVDMKFTEKISKEDFMTVGIELMSDNINPLVEIIAYAVTNSESKPSKKLLRFLRANITMVEILDLLSLVIKQMNVAPFMSSIISVKGMSLIKP